MTSKRNESNREHESNRAISRRDGLKALGLSLGLGAGVFSTAGRAASESDAPTQTKTYSLKQGDKCIPLTPLVGKQPVQKLYDYTYPTKLFTGTPGSFGWSYASEGMTSLLRDQTSVLFLYHGPNGLSLVICHGRHTENGSDPGGAVSFTITNFPEDGEWFVKDDLYVSRKTGKKYKTNYDTWSVDGDRSVVNWTYKQNRTDGGVLRGLGTSFDFTIHPAFNEQAKLYNKGQHGPITHWQALSGDRSSPKRIELRMDEPVTISSKTCGSSGDEGGKDGQDGNDRTDGGDQHDDTGTDHGNDGADHKDQNCSDGTNSDNGGDEHSGDGSDGENDHQNDDCGDTQNPKHGHEDGSTDEDSNEDDTEDEEGGC